MGDMWAIDPLAQAYCDIFDYRAHNVVVPQSMAAEDIMFRDMFDVVHARNSLDRTQVPVAAFAAMVRALKKDGVLIISGFEKYGSSMYGLASGAYQWDLSLNKQGDLGLNHVEDSATITELTHSKIKPFCGATTVQPGGRRWFTWMGKKIEA